MRYFLVQDKVDNVYEVVKSDLYINTFRNLLNHCKRMNPDAYGSTELVGQIAGGVLPVEPYTYTEDQDMFAGYHRDYKGTLPEAFLARCDKVMADVQWEVNEVQDALLHKLHRKGLPS